MADYVPVYSGGVQPFTTTTSGAVTGGALVQVSGAGTVATAAAGAITIGVAAHDAASGSRLTVWPLANVVHEITTTGTVTAADGVIAGASGTVATATIATAAAAGTLLGIATTTATTGNKVRFIGRG